MKTLFVIPARGGSKGIPYKNIKSFVGKPLIYYAIDAARQFTDDTNICVSTDDQEIAKTVENYGLKVPFMRPAALATDTATSDDVLLHAINFYSQTYAQQGIHYDNLVLLQTTSPFRKAEHIKQALALYHNAIDMVVSVFETEANPYYVLCEENENGFLQKSKSLTQNITRRQDVPKVWQYNGAIYIINIKQFLLHQKLSALQKVVKYEMESLHSLDLDTPLDWAYGEFLVEKEYVKL